jgi:lactoylglutathione lyase
VPPRGQSTAENEMNAQTKTPITDVRTVGVPVSDQDRALACYADELGFETRLDVAVHADLQTRGVDVGELLRWPGVPPMFAVRDQDGNGLEIVEQA